MFLRLSASSSLILRTVAGLALGALAVPACADDDPAEAGGNRGGRGGRGGSASAGEGGDGDGASGRVGDAGGSGDGGSGDGGSGSSSVPEPTPTDVGTLQGDPVSSTIGSDGGSLLSADGRLELIVPAGALSEDTELTIESVTNTAHGGVGVGYELSPTGQMFESPVELVLHYDDADVLGTAPQFLSWAFQNEDGFWELLETDEDTAASTLSATTTHFTPFSAISEVRISPTSAEVKVEGFVGFELEYCVKLNHRVGTETVLAFRCTTPGALIHSHLGTWAVNDIPGGNSEVGTAAAVLKENMSYEAPAEVPSPDTVTVSVDLTELNGESTAPVSAQVRILPKSLPYRGDYEFTLSHPGQHATGTAHLIWTPTDIAADVENYNASGTINATLTYDDCEPLSIAAPIAEGSLTFYTSANSAYANQHGFLFYAMQDVTLTCGEDSVGTSVGLALQGGYCNAPPFAPVADPAELSGTESCATSFIEANWSFVRDEP